MVGLTDRRIRQMISDGIVSTTKDRKCDLYVCIREYIEYNSAKKTDVEQSELERLKLQEQIKHETAKCEITELKLAKMKGDLHEGDIVKAVLEDMCLKFRSKCLAIPTKAAAQISGDSMSMAEIEGILEKEIYEALTELSEYEPKMFYDEDYIMDDINEVEADQS